MVSRVISKKKVSAPEVEEEDDAESEVVVTDHRINNSTLVQKILMAYKEDLSDEEL